MTTLTVRRFASRAALDAALVERLARAIATGGGVSVPTATGGFKSQPTVDAPIAASASIGSEIVPHSLGLAKRAWGCHAPE